MTEKAKFFCKEGRIIKICVRKRVSEKFVHLKWKMVNTLNGDQR